MVREGANSIVSKGPFPGRKKSRSERPVKTLLTVKLHKRWIQKGQCTRINVDR